MKSGKCHRCRETGHWAADCPLQLRASSWDEHLGRIAGFINKMADGVLTIEQKRVAISTENILWHGDRCRRELMYP